MKKLNRNAPRTLSERLWYYVNDGSIDLVTDVNGFTDSFRITRRQLARMLSEMRPIRRRLARRGGSR